MRETADKKREARAVSVCIPTYNYGRFLPDAIDSVLAQSFTDFELIICDNASSDDTEDVVRRYKDPRIRYCRYRINVPVVYNFNRSLELVSSERVLMLCADDMLAPGTLELLVSALDSHPSAALAMAVERRTVDEAGNPVGDVSRLPCGPGLVRGNDVLVSQCCHVHSVGIPSQVLARTDVVLQHAGFDPHVGISNDVDLYCRICRHWDAVYVEDAAFYYRQHPGTETQKHCTNLNETKARFAVIERLFQSSDVLQGNRALKRTSLRNRVYPIFATALDDVRRGDMRALLWMALHTAKFEPLPWWFPYYLSRYASDRVVSLFRRLREFNRGLESASAVELQ